MIPPYVGLGMWDGGVRYIEWEREGGVMCVCDRWGYMKKVHILKEYGCFLEKA